MKQGETKRRVENKYMKSELEKFRTRWYRWLGQKTRCDKPYWVTLLDCNWSGWASKVLDRAGLDLGYLTPTSSRHDVYYYFQTAIAEADMKDLMKLDNLYATDIIEKRGW